MLGDTVTLFIKVVAHSLLTYGPLCDKICLRGFANNKGLDQPARLRNLVSAFVIR